MSSGQLTSSAPRIVTVDALRGVALFGILYAHMIFWYTAGPLPEHLFKDNTTLVSGIVMALYGLLFLSKFFSFFSFLFGLSFYIQMKSLLRNNDNFIVRYGWRLLILGVIGLIHHALWRGDILSIYVPLGFLLLFARNLSDKAILIIGFIFILNIPNKIYDASMAMMQINSAKEAMETMQVNGQHYYEVVKNGSFIEVVRDNWQALDFKFNYQITSGRLVITFGFFLLGMFVGRQRWFENPDQVKPEIKKIWKMTSFILIGLAGLFIVVGLCDQLMQLKLTEKPWGMWTYGILADFFNSGLTIFYISGLTLLMYRAKWQKILFPLSNVGKMALTSYLMQSLFGLLLFYSFGLGLFTKTSPAVNSLLCIGIFIFQALFSKMWLVYFTYGPVEWVWRSLTYLKLQPFLRKQNHVPFTEPVRIE